MSGTTVPVRDSSLADLIGPGDSFVPNAPRSAGNVGTRHHEIHGLVGERETIEVDNRARLDDVEGFEWGSGYVPGQAASFTP